MDFDIPLSKTDAELQEILDALNELDERKRYHAIEFFDPYFKQQEFFDAGGFRERLFKAGNQLGKSEAGAFEVACHLTGLYPDWWLGRRFTKPTKGWAAGESTTVVRDVSQKKLCGEPGIELAFGTGMIPKDCFDGRPTLARGITDGFDTIKIKHYASWEDYYAGNSDGVSTLQFKSYEQGRTKFQGTTLDFVWLDEEPDMDIYSECLTRTNHNDGFVFVTFTPLKGRSAVVNRYLDEPSPDRTVITMTIYDVPMSDEKRKKIIDGYPSHEREARAMGLPLLGSGRVFPYSEDSIAEDPLIYIPQHWVKGWGIDFGIGHPFAAVLMMWDRDNDVIHVHAAMRMADALPLQHAAMMKPIGADVPVSWPHDGDSREKSSGETIAKSYKSQGLRMQPEHAQFAEGGYDTEAGVLEMSQRMTTGRLKVARHLAAWFEEFREYHRKDGQIVKMRDDLMSATRIGIMDRRNWKLCVLGSKRPKPKRESKADADFDPWTGQ